MVAEPEDKQSSGFFFADEITDEMFETALLRRLQEHTRYSIYAFFAKEHTNKEKADFLKEYFGLSGQTLSFSDDVSGYIDANTKGMKLSILGNWEVNKSKTWAAIQKLITGYIDNGSFLSEAQMANIPYYQRWREIGQQIATDESNAYYENIQRYNQAKIERRYDLSVGTKIFIENEYHEILEASGDKVILRDPATPLLTKEKDRESLLEEMFADDTRNHHLLLVDEVEIDESSYDYHHNFDEWMREEKERERNTEPQPERPILPEAQEKSDPTPGEQSAHLPEAETEYEHDTLDDISLGTELGIEDRRYLIESVNYDFGKVSMRDITFQDETGFPIFRSETVEYVRQLLEEMQQSVPQEPTQTDTLAPSKLEEVETPQAADYRITDDQYGVAGAKTRFQKNIAAIRMMQSIENEDRAATPDEQDVLAGFTGWGAIP
ncbi:MAG: hypothetical protein ACOYJB_10735, partial [Christensenellaceae bacterium]